MSMTYRVFIVFLVLMAGYASYEIIRFSMMNAKIDSAPAAFFEKGPEEASIVMVEFMDFTCGFCKQIHQPIEDFLDIRSDVRFVARPYPVLGEEAERIARIAMAAGLQDAYWEFHEAFLSNPNEITDAFIRETANLYGLNVDQLFADSESEKVKEMLQDNIDDAQALGVYSTPSVFVNKTIIQSFEKMPTAADLVRLVEDAS